MAALIGDAEVQGVEAARLEASSDESLQALSEHRPGRAQPPSRYECRAELAVGLPFLGAAVALALLGDADASLKAGPAIALVLSYAVLSRVRFHAGGGQTCRRSDRSYQFALQEP